MEAEDEDWDRLKLINKGIKYINLPSIFNDIYTASSVPYYFEKREFPTISYI